MRAPHFVLLLLLAAPVLGDEEESCVTTQSDIVTLIDSYSRSSGTKFVVDPRVAAKVTLVGIDPSNLTAGTLIGVLNMHGFAALESEGVVYVMPFVVADESGDMFGDFWEG